MLSLVKKTMAIIDLHKKRKTSGSYERILGDKRFSNLVRSIHAASITSGTQVSFRLKHAYIGNLPTFNGKSVNTPLKTLKVIMENPEGVIIFGGFIPKKNSKKQEIDLIILFKGKLYCFEIKEGNALDTKKSEVEIDGIEIAVEYFSEKKYDTQGGLILLYMTNGIHSVKDQRSDKYIISGTDFCEKFHFDFQKFNSYQEHETKLNLQIVADEARLFLKEYDNIHN